MITEEHILPYHTSPLPEGPWLVFAPHPDDETFGMGGSILRAREEGIAVDVVIMTDGALGGSAVDLVARRQQEAARAGELLGLRRLDFLGEPDRGLRRREELCEKVKKMIVASAAATVFFPGLLEPHPDHRATAHIVWRSLQALPAPRPHAVAYEITVQNPVNRFIDISAQREAKDRVLAVYLSQLQESNYRELIRSLNKSRSFTLGTQASYAEAFYCFSDAELQQALADVMLARLERQFEE